VEGVEGVGIKGGVAPPTTLLIVGRCAAIHAAHCFAIRGGLRPWAGVRFSLKLFMTITRP